MKNKHVRDFIEFVKEDKKSEAYKSLSKAVLLAKENRVAKIKASVDLDIN